MRIANGIFAALLLLFAAVQFNDPDFLFWGTLYAAGAVICGLAALRPRVLAGLPLRLAYFSGLAGVAVGLVVFWPDTPQWWMEDVWWNTETAREGMGMMVLALGMVLALPLVIRKRP